MQKVKKILLKSEKTIHYFSEQIEYENALFETIKKEIDLRKGYFFTVLPDSADLKKLYNFSVSILPLAGRAINSKFANAWKIQTTNEELSQFIYSFLQKEPNHIAIFDHVVASPTQPNLEVNEIQLAFYQNQVYFLARQDASSESILEAITEIKEIWHFLIVLTEEVSPFKSNLTEQDFTSICDRAKYIITGAYDGESYIFWEKQ